jgi:ATP-binding cassette subfamily C protein CydCD
MRRRRPQVADRGVVALLGLAAVLRAIGTVLVAEGLARGVAAVAGRDDWRLAVLVGAVGCVLRALAAWAAPALGARAGADLVADLRGGLAARALGPGAPRDTVLLGAHRLDDLQAYCTTVLPSLVNAAVIPVLIGLRILLADWVSAVVIACTLPLVPLFMALVGMHTRDRITAATAALDRLTGHLLELAKGLPVLVGLGRIDEQAAVLHRISEEHRRRTTATLRVVFLSSLVLELVATLSVAVVAVTVGLRLLAGDLPLWAGLLALVLAPECFGALRDVGAAFHAGEAGLAAHDRAREILDRPAVASPRETGPVRLDGVIVHHAGRGTVLAGLDLTPADGAVTAILGPSGSGKSTVLAAFAGLLDGDGTTIAGTVTVPAGGIAYLPQHPSVTEDTVLGEVRLYGPGVPDAPLRTALARVGLADVADEDPRRLSPGELRRLGMVRVLARVRAGARLVLLDEPTAHLDDRSRRVVDGMIADLRGVATVLVATHEASTAAVADHVLRLGGESAAADAGATPGAAAVATPRTAGDDPRGSLATLASTLRPVSRRLLAGGLLGVASATAAVALIAVSGWLIVRAADQPEIFLLSVAIVGVRFFGIARACLRYAERLVTHVAVLRTVTVLRDRLWRGLATHGARTRTLVDGATALELLVVGVDRVRDLLPRLLLPPFVAAALAVGAGTAVLLLHPAAAPVLAVGLAVAFVLAPVVALLAEGAAGARAVELRAALARRFTASVAAADDLRANGADPQVLAALRDLDVRLRLTDRRSALARGAGDAIAVLGCCGTAIAMVAVGAATGAAAPVVGVLALLPLALLEPAQVLVDGVRNAPAFAAAWSGLSPVLRPAAAAATGTATPIGPVASLSLEGVGTRWSDDGPLVFDRVDATVRRGQWLVIEGASGAGKSTLLSVLLGALPAAEGRYRLGGDDVSTLAPAALTGRVAWLPQDAHVFDSTVRANLLLGARGATDEELMAVLDRVGLGPLVRRASDGLDLRVGAGGKALSGGERTRLALARTLLSDAAVVLLDEPTAHLDAATAAGVMADLRASLADRIVVLVSHRRSDRDPADIVIELGHRAVEAGEGAAAA